MLSKTGPAYTEIGQIIMTNGQTYGNEAYWATDGLVTLAKVIREYREYPQTEYNLGPLLTSNDGDVPYENDTFAMRTYCWCDGDIKGHEDICPPNFLYKPSGIEMSWYKHAGRGITSNVGYLSELTWHRVINDCIESIVK